MLLGLCDKEKLSRHSNIRQISRSLSWLDLYSKQIHLLPTSNRLFFTLQQHLYGMKFLTHPPFLKDHCIIIFIAISSKCQCLKIVSFTSIENPSSFMITLYHFSNNYHPLSLMINWNPSLFYKKHPVLLKLVSNSQGKCRPANTLTSKWWFLRQYIRHILADTVIN
jgi:hypothetical protein